MGEELLGMVWYGILYLNQETRQPQQHSAGLHGGRVFTNIKETKTNKTKR